MKIFLRILNYANTIGRRLGFFFFYSILGIIFGAFNIVLVGPMLQVLFDRTKKGAVPPLPEFSLSTDYIKGAFDHYFLGVVIDKGPHSALLFVCGLIVACV